MDESENQQRLSRICTHWSVVCQAHQGTGSAVTSAQQELLKRYFSAIYRYVLAAVRDPHVAEELCQDFALQFVQGNLKRADPERGRFRDYVKTILFHMVGSWRRKQHNRPHAYDSEIHTPADSTPPAEESDQVFLDGWRQELLGQTWQALERVQQETGQPFHTVLSFRARHAELKSEEMARQLSEVLGKPVTAAGVRQTLHRAREKFANLLLEEVGRSLETTDTSRLTQELIDLGLYEYCKDALTRLEG
jgi:RNA polymerase sigma-70 factor (ECF subfamily)